MLNYPCYYNYVTNKFTCTLKLLSFAQNSEGSCICQTGYQIPCKFTLDHDPD